MPNPRLATRYAKSLIDLAVEKDQLEAVYADMQYLKTVCKMSPGFVTMLKSPVIKADKKQAVMSAITTGKVNVITEGFNRLMISKGREDVLPEIIFAFTEQYNVIKGINKVKLTTAQPISEAVKQAILNKVNVQGGLTNVELETVVNEDLIGGFVLEYNNNLVDASILRDLKDVKKQFMSNDYIFNIR